MAERRESYPTHLEDGTLLTVDNVPVAGYWEGEPVHDDPTSERLYAFRERLKAQPHDPRRAYRVDFDQPDAVPVAV